MALVRCQSRALLLIAWFGLSSVAFADSPARRDARQTGYTLVDDADVAHHLNSFAMIFGRCVWVPPSPKAALAAFSLFFGVDTRTEPDIAAAEAVIINQYIGAGKSQPVANQELAWLNGCFATYEAPSENKNHPAEPDVAQHLQ